MIDPHRFSAFSLASKAIHGYAPADTLYRSVACPIYQTSTFVNPALGSDIRYSYSRCDNPTRTCLEDTIALLEGGRAGFAFSSGLAAVLAVFSLLKSGDHVIVSDDVYGGTYRQINELWKHLGIAFDAVDIGNTGRRACARSSEHTDDLRRNADQSHDEGGGHCRACGHCAPERCASCHRQHVFNAAFPTAAFARCGHCAAQCHQISVGASRHACRACHGQTTKPSSTVWSLSSAPKAPALRRSTAFWCCAA